MAGNQCNQDYVCHYTQDHASTKELFLIADARQTQTLEVQRAHNCHYHLGEGFPRAPQTLQSILYDLDVYNIFLAKFI